MKRARSATLPGTILKALAELQDGLNSMIDPNWRTVRSLDNWALAITMESAELLDSYPWKWWKNIHATPDFDNIKIELVDILHFSLAGTMQTSATEQNKLPAALGKQLEDAFTPFVSTSEGTVAAVNNMVYLPLSRTDNAIASFRNVIQLSNAYRFDVITEAIICAAEDLDFNLVAYYVAKHTLNYIRQLGGYRSGTYVKVNDGVEDNVLLHNCIKGITVEEALDEIGYLSVWNGIMEKVFQTFQVAAADRRDFKHWSSLAQRVSDAQTA